MRLDRAPLLAALALIAAQLCAHPAHASRPATVDVENVELREGPGVAYRVIDRLPKGSPVAASNEPTENYYKIRTSAGLIGFVKADSLILQPIPSEDSPSVAQAAPPPLSGGPGTGSPVAPSDAYKPTVATDSGFRQKTHRKYFRVKMLGGYNLFSVGDVNALLGADVLKNGFNLGGEANFLFTPDLALVLRLERVFMTVFARDTKTNHTFQMDLSSWPLMLGLELALTSSPKFSTHFAVMGGLGLVTGLTATDLSEPSPNVTQLGTTTFAGLAKLDASYVIYKGLAGFLEIGYRYVRTPQVIPAESQAGSDVLKSKGEFVPVAIDLSGPYASLGLSFTF